MSVHIAVIKALHFIPEFIDGYIDGFCDNSPPGRGVMLMRLHLVVLNRIVYNSGAK
jgi:hypothetical protein